MKQYLGSLCFVSQWYLILDSSSSHNFSQIIDTFPLLWHRRALPFFQLKFLILIAVAMSALRGSIWPSLLLDWDLCWSKEPQTIHSFPSFPVYPSNLWDLFGMFHNLLEELSFESHGVDISSMERRPFFSVSCALLRLLHCSLWIWW